MAKARARGEVVPVRVPKTAFRGTLHNLCYLRLAPAQGFDPKKSASAPAQALAFLRMRGMRKWGARNCDLGARRKARMQE